MKKESIFELLSQKINKENIFCDEPMNRHTSFKIGGNADFFIKAKTIEEITWGLKVSKENNIPITVVGNGTNLLVKDSGIRGIVLKPELNSINIEDNIIIADAGVLLTILSKKTIDLGLKGLEFAYGIPGTIGGAIRMNAGAYGGEMKDVVEETTYITYDGFIHTIKGDEHKFSYRNSLFANMESIILNTKIKLSYGNTDELKAIVKENMDKRKNSQPLEFPNAGSTFKRGNGYITAQLIDEAGLKGVTIGDAMVSTKHAGFIVNKGNAKAKDILDLVDLVKKKVFEKTNKNIELEIIVIGEE